jgi:predicted MPP superfamily phosphohydrolase
MILTAVYHLILSAVDVLLLWGIVRRSPTSVLRFLNLTEQIVLAAPILAFILSWLCLGKTDNNLAVHGLAWHGSFFLITAAVLMYRQKINAQKRRIFPIGVFLFGLCYLTVAVDSLLYEPTALTVKYQTIRTPKVTKTVKNVFLADIQTNHPGWYERKALKQVKEQNADLILFGGDYVQGDDATEEDGLVEEFNAMLREAGLQAPLGIFAVNGNHEFGGIMPRLFQGTAVQVKSGTSSMDAGELRLTFLSMGASFVKRTYQDYYRDDRFRIIVGHAPLYAMATQDAELLLAGHTHGGQVQIPFYGPPITHSGTLPRHWASGVTKMDNEALLVVSNGVGMERGSAPQIRFFCRPDFWVIELLPEK